MLSNRNGIKRTGLAGIAGAAGIAAALAGAAAAQPAITVGPRETIIASKTNGFDQFPEAPISIISTNPLRVIIAAGARSLLATSATGSWKDLKASGVALAPSGSGYDVLAAHIGGVWKDGNDLYAVFKGWDPNGVPRIKGADTATYDGRYWTLALAKSTDNGQTFQKIGPILQSPKHAVGDALQGDGHASVLIDKDKQNILLYYTDWNARTKGTRGTQICMAKAPLSGKGAPGTWKKYKDGDFTLAGLSANDTGYGEGPTPIISGEAWFGDAMYPHVIYSEKAKHYIGIFSVYVGFEGGPLSEAQMSGVYMAFSQDGIIWHGHTQVIKSITIDYPGDPVALYPTLVVDDAASTDAKLKGQIFYGYQDSMWFKGTQYLAAQPVEIPIPYDFTASVKPGIKSGARDVGFSATRMGARELVLDFSRVRPEALRLVGVDGRSAGRVSAIGAGRFRVELAGTSRGLHFLQGRSQGKAFTRSLMID